MPDNKHLGSGILPIAASNRHICLAWRSAKVSEGNRWGVVGGLVKQGMNEIDSALLEMKEEVGYSGPVELHHALVHNVPGFSYHTFVGIVPEPFSFNPEPEHAWETSFIGWFPYQQVCSLLEEHPNTFHRGLKRLFRECKTLIEHFTL